MSIRVKLFALTAVVLAVVVSVITAWFSFTQVGHLQASLQEKAARYAAMTSQATASALAFDDTQTAREAFEAAALDPDVVAIVLRRENGGVLYRHVRPQGGGDVLAVTVPVRSAEGPTGTLEIQLSDERVAATARSTVAGTALASLLALLLGCSAAWIVGGSFARRVAAVTEHARAVADDDLGHPPLRATSTDEIGVLARAFDSMVENIEARVQRRTAELGAANAELAARSAALKQSEDENRAIVQNAADGIFTADAQGLVRSFNAAAESIFRVSCDDVVGRPLSDLLKRASVRVGRTEETITRADGSNTQLEVRVTEVHGDAGTMRVGLVRDLADEKRVAGQLAELNSRLVDASRLAGMADVASGILHNVGNVLNSVNVSATLLDDTVRRSGVESVVKVSDLIKANGARLDAFFTTDAKGKKVPEFLDGVGKRLMSEREKLLEEIGSLRKNVDHIREIVSMQQAYTTKSGVEEHLQLTDTVDDAIEMSIETKGAGEIEVVRDYGEMPLLLLDRHRAMQILVNLLRNARHAVRDSGRSDPRITVRLHTANDRLRLSVEDNGIGIDDAGFLRLFQQGYTTKPDGHGYGLHSSANTAKELGGSLVATSDGAGKGATFVLDLPLSLAPTAHAVLPLQRAAA